ncbi:acetyl-CoA C-acetyltransferase [Latilactobacillus curvatus]|uniref:acetyl-CoA C-acetyltransferase n=1 Tax=Latilactobacillus curvatus TaxID=28038 RepID=A0ABN6GJW5_LATCU|nr:acetyl-CoA C-acetyltransferase [Latilactobacillus curvatus]ANY13344.1 3-ketoacyl-CoA thiolase [Latilactobacillus curvatus]EHE85349.1 putative acetyl-CoA acyltransferase [Latilactobacillus curvatus CRL 705]MCM0724912.1 acetyl-CoA C-acetyltransferase [Latilactobacillus curvatus]MCM6844182.1 acetyl-CoA C-acetyltransferase [Latilactobacillus curvatus]MCM6860931.1 acetyl-CoA C-acetyltransferase [Latilactobacillus curvatus]
MQEVVIISAKRTPIGKLGGQLASLSAVELGTVAAKAAIEAAGIDPTQIDQAIFGNVLQAGSGQNVARQIALKSGMTQSSTAMTVNEVCGSGLKAIRLAQSAIVMGDADIVLVGGTESMSQAPYLNKQMRFGSKFGDQTMIDSISSEGLNDAFTHQPMGITGENVAAKYGVTREMQDAFALASHQKAAQATQAGWFNEEIVPVTVQQRKATLEVQQDEGIRPTTTIEAMAKLRPAFQQDGTVTPANASGINDGASAMIVMSKEKAAALGLVYQATLVGYQEVGADPDYMGYTPVDAIQKLLAQQNQTLADIDLLEINEAFAASSVAVQNGLQVDPAKVNVAGGAIALGHPIGASGTRIMTTLMHQLKRTHQTTGIASLCIGGGLGIAFEIQLNEAWCNEKA